MRSEQSWSLLDPRPVLLYVSSCDDYIVYWNGIATTHAMALCIAMEQSAGIWPTPEMKTSLEENYRKIYYTNGFGTRAWDSKVQSGFVYPYIKRILAEHVAKTVEGKDAKDVLSWFDYKRARKEEHV